MVDVTAEFDARYSCDTYHITLQDSDELLEYDIKHWIARPVCYVFGMLDAVAICVLFSHWAMTASEPIGFIVLAGFFSTLALFMGALGGHCLWWMWKIKRTVCEAQHYTTMDRHMGLVFVEQIKNSASMLSMC